jgi:hypothetical protein
MTDLAQQQEVACGNFVRASGAMPEVSGLGPGLQLLVFLASCVMLILRRPDVIFRPQFFAEDGVKLYAGAYQLGLRSLLIIDGGYLHVAGQLVAHLAQFVPFAMAPVVMAAAAIMARALPVNVFLSSRFSWAGKLWFRALLCAAYLALPNTSELFGNVATLQWHLALLSCMVVLASSSGKLYWRVFDVAVLVALSLESPTAFLLLPLCAFLWWRERNRWTFFQALALLPGSMIQLLLVTTHAHDRAVAPLGPTFTRFFNILTRQIFLSSLLGTRALSSQMAKPWYNAFSAAIAILGLSAMLYALLKGPLRLKLFMTFGLMITAVSMARPLASADQPQWQVMQNPGCTCRYWEIPMLAFLACLVWIASTRRSPLRYAAVATLLLMPFGICHDWRYVRFPDEHFAQYARRFADAQPGTSLVIPVDPPGWQMVLRKR